MPLFSYEGLKITGENCKGTVRGNSVSEAQEKLREKKIKVLAFIEQDETIFNKEIKILNAVSEKKLFQYLQQMSTLINAGITILEASTLLEKQISDKNFKKNLEEVRKDLENGEMLSVCYRKHPRVFPPLLVNVIAVAEISGELESNLNLMAKYYEKSSENRSSLITALIYPMIMLVAAIGVSVFLMMSIVPMFVGIFQSLGAPLPAITRITMSISNFLTTRYPIILLFISICIVVGVIAKRDKRIRLHLDRLKLKLPIFGDFVQKNEYSIFLITLSTLLASSVPMIKALQMSGDVIKNMCIRELVSKCELEIEQGGRLSNIFSKSSVAPVILVQMLEIGERTGTLDNMLLKLSSIFEKEVTESSKRIKTILEPLVTAFIAVIVGFIVAAIMIPMLSMYTTIQG